KGRKYVAAVSEKIASFLVELAQADTAALYEGEREDAPAGPSSRQNSYRRGRERASDAAHTSSGWRRWWRNGPTRWRCRRRSAAAGSGPCGSTTPCEMRPGREERHTAALRPIAPRR